MFTDQLDQARDNINLLHKQLKYHKSQPSRFYLKMQIESAKRDLKKAVEWYKSCKNDK